MKMNLHTCTRYLAGIAMLLAASTAPAQGLFNAWRCKAQIQFTGYTMSETLTNFPALVYLGTNISGFAYNQSPVNGQDVRFTDATGTTELNYERENWNPNGLSAFWVQVPTLTNNTSIIAYWGNSTTAPAYTTNGATWSNQYDYVCHLNNTNNLTDSSTNNFPQTNFGATNATGIINGGAGFLAASNTYIDCGSSVNEPNTLTVECWYNFTAPVATFSRMISNLSGSPYCGYEMYVNKNGDNTEIQLQTGYNSGANLAQEWTTSSFPAGVWHHVVGTVTGAGTLTLYVDGTAPAQATAGAHVAPASSAHLNLNRSSGAAGSYCTGLMDEARVSSVCRSANWIWADYMNVASNIAVFQTYGVASVKPTGTMLLLK